MSLQLAWAAGIIDGEGCISLRYDRTGYQLRIVVVNTSRVMVERLHAIFPKGRVRLYHAGNKKWRPRVEFVLSASAAAEALKSLLPFLVNKKPEAELALYSRSLIGARAGRTNPNRTELDSIVVRLKEMKKAA